MLSNINKRGKHFHHSNCEFLLIAGCNNVWFALAKPEKSPTYYFCYFSSTHCTEHILRHYQQASELAIQKEHLSIYRNTQLVISLWFCVLYIWKLFNLPTVLSLKHCKKRAFSAINTATDYQWCEKIHRTPWCVSSLKEKGTTTEKVYGCMTRFRCEN